jgi:N-acetylglucosaminyldiphosphoundecaprenol N-acetyl-beta-D-mannosaminyltransferase
MSLNPYPILHNPRVAYFHGVKHIPVSIVDALREIITCIPQKKGDFFCFANVHLIMECHNDSILKVLNQSAANFPDGMAVAWALKLLGNKFKGRVRGTDCMLRLCSYASENNFKIFLYGSTEKALVALQEKLKSLFRGIEIAGAISPPFRELTDEEDQAMVDSINKAAPDILFVSLGAPKQEKWMAEHKGRIKAIQLGVGAAFNFITGEVKQAPVWMQRVGLEWLYRMPQQPQKTMARMSLLPGFCFKTLLQLINKR